MIKMIKLISILFIVLNLMNSVLAENTFFDEGKIKYDKNNIQEILDLNNFNLTSEEFFTFIHDSLTLREELKFEFSHNLTPINSCIFRKLWN